MRILLSGLLAVGLLSGQVAQAQNCARPADKTAFDVAGLKSQLMVTAITCEATERYNTFIARYRPDLLAQEKVIKAYFVRNFGKKAQSQQDDYITSLANAQSQNGLKAGTAFCDRNLSMFEQVMKVHSGAELGDFASGTAPIQPITLVACMTPGSGRALVRTASATVVTKSKTR